MKLHFKAVFSAWPAATLIFINLYFTAWAWRALRPKVVALTDKSQEAVAGKGKWSFGVSWGTKRIREAVKKENIAVDANLRGSLALQSAQRSPALDVLSSSRSSSRGGRISSYQETTVTHKSTSPKSSIEGWKKRKSFSSLPSVVFSDSACPCMSCQLVSVRYYLQGCKWGRWNI